MRSPKLYLIILFSIALFSCHSPGKDLTNSYKGIPGAAIPMQDLQKDMIGKWATLRDTLLSFSIDTGNNIFYYNANAGYTFTFKQDSMTIKFDDDIYHARIKMLSKDTLIMIGTGKDKGNIDSVYRADGLGDQ